jgi:hypothetical protein
MLAQLWGCHPVLAVSFEVPLATYIVLLRLSGQISRTMFLALLVVVLLFELFTSAELFATTALFGAAALALSWLFYRTPLAADIRDVAIEIGCGYLVVAYWRHPTYITSWHLAFPPRSIQARSLPMICWLFAVPTPVLYAGRAFSQVVSQFTSGPVETAAYLGPGFWIILVLYTESSWSTHTGRFLIVSLLLTGLMSLGPTLHIDGISRRPAPWRLFSQLPLIDLAGSLWYVLLFAGRSNREFILESKLDFVVVQAAVIECLRFVASSIFLFCQERCSQLLKRRELSETASPRGTRLLGGGFP